MRVVISGLGRMGAGPRCADGTILSHLDAVLSCKEAELVAVVEPNQRNFAEVQERFPDHEFNLYRNLSDVSVNQVDLVVLSGPTECRKEEISSALLLHPRILLVEKPLAASLDDSVEIVSLLRESTVEVRVNFNRRFDPRHLQLKSDLPDQSPEFIGLRYSNGLFNFSSHVVDLIQDWFGEFTSVQTHCIKKYDDDYLASFDARLSTGTRVHMSGRRSDSIAVFDLEIQYSDRRYVLENGGIRIYRQKVEKNSVYPGYAVYGNPEYIVPPSSPVSGIMEFYHSAVSHITHGEYLPGCNLNDAVRNIEVLDAVIRSGNNCEPIQSIYQTTLQ